jgi:hypothetical protein
MNPLCLLTKGRTFKDMAVRPGAYKLLANSALPKFTPGKRVSAPASEPAIAQVAQPTLFEPKPASIKAPAIEAPKVVAPALSPSPFTQYAKNAEKTSFRGTLKKGVCSCKELVQRFIFGRKGRPVHKATVQTELALEKVTVLKNDLNEDDLEVVLVERKVGRGEKPLASLNKTEMGGEAWIRLTAPFRKKSSESVFSSKAETKPSPELSAHV